MGEMIYDYPEVAYAVVAIFAVLVLFRFRTTKMRGIGLIICIILGAYVHYEASRSPLERVGSSLSSGLQHAGDEAQKLFR